MFDNIILVINYPSALLRSSQDRESSAVCSVTLLDFQNRWMEEINKHPTNNRRYLMNTNRAWISAELSVCPYAKFL